MLGVNSEQKESMQHYISVSIYGLTLAWITSENSTKQLECRHLDTIFFAGLYLLLLCPESTASLRVISPTPLSVVPRQLPCQLLSPTNLSFCVPLTTSGYGKISGPKNPLSGFATKQTKESSAWRATYIVLHSNQTVQDISLGLKDSWWSHKVR